MCDILNLDTQDLEIISNIKLDSRGTTLFNFTRVSCLYIPLLVVLTVVIWPA